MITVKQVCPPSQFKPDGIGEPVIGLRILIVPDVITPLHAPAQNRDGTKILCRLLQARLELAGMRVSKASCGLPLNRSFYMFSVSELLPAQESIKAELEELGLLERAQIAWRDPREEVWRVWYSKAGCFEPPSDEELVAEQDSFARIISAVEKSKQLEDGTSGQ